MVETKTAKRKLQNKVIARAANEAAIERKQTASVARKPATPKQAPAAAHLAAASGKKPAASPRLISPVTSRTRSKKGTASATKAAAAGNAAKGGKGKAVDDAAEAEKAEAIAGESGEEESDADSDDGGAGLGSQRLVVKLGDKQQRDLSAGLSSIAAGPANKPGAEVGAKEDKTSGVVYVGRIPFGFFEDQMRPYFAQFGEVARLRVSRNKKTGKSKHYAFVEFLVPEVAEIVAKTHDNMLMCDRAIKCSVVDADKVHPKMFKGADEKFKPHPWKKMAREAANGKRTQAQEKARMRALVGKERKKRKALEAAGIELDFIGYEGLYAEKKPKRTRFD